ncbi:Replication A 1A-like protein [Theobroma cacao]|uniref:Replication A 1A-like protein n=1 Tax=Theobroma cacao TaxID=3641 RepID=A0A061GLN3_THECC|nr:Replication A 1A-like protein [Theobroma cacao]
MPVNLTRNAIASINTGDVNSKPLVQVVDIKLIGNSQERYRFLLSDSESSQHAMLATQLNEQVRTGRVKKGSIIQLIDYVCSTVQNRRIIVVLNMETIIPEYEIIGNPKLLTDSDSTTNKSLPNLTRNAIVSINAGDVNSKPLVQVVGIKLIGNSQERYRFLLSDSESSQHAMLATQLNEQVRTGRVKKGSIIQLIDYVCSTVQNREKGRRIRELTSVVQKRFKFPENSVELYAEKVNNRGLCTIAQGESSLQASRRSCCPKGLLWCLEIHHGEWCQGMRGYC